MQVIRPQTVNFDLFQVILTDELQTLALESAGGHRLDQQFAGSGLKTQALDARVLTRTACTG